MIFALYGMPLFPVLEFLLVASSVALAQENEFTVARDPRAAVENRLEPLGGGTAIPNHLPGEEDPKLALFTTAPFITTKESRTTGKGNQLLLTALVTTTVAPSPKTMAPTTVNGRDVRLADKTTLSTGLLSPTFTSLPPPTNSTTPAKKDSTTTSNNSWTVKSTPSAPITTEKGPQCNCSAEGTVEPLTCDPLTGQCVCVEGYSGLQCDACEDGYFTNGTSGCQPCGCDSYGAVGPLCNGSGVCTCKMGVYGDKCDDCRPGFFLFSDTGCQPCQCNNHTSNCDTQSGICLNCQGNTKGPHCGDCKYNFYREPGSALTEVCLPCPCSSVTSTGSCTLDLTGQPVCDQCKTEYKGPNCEQCSDGFYNADSICVPCNCSGNEQPSYKPRICHPDTGHCVRCSHNTAGPHCERCAEGFTGDALSKNCTPIVLTTPPQLSTMTPSPNGTEQLPTFSTALSSLASPTANSSSTTAADVSWAQFNVIVLAVIIVVLVALMGVAGGVYTYREYQNRKLNAPFWTIELKEDNISFSSYHDSIPNADVSGLLEDEMSEVASNGQLTLSSPGNLYKA